MNSWPGRISTSLINEAIFPNPLVSSIVQLKLNCGRVKIFFIVILYSTGVGEWEGEGVGKWGMGLGIGVEGWDILLEKGDEEGMESGIARGQTKMGIMTGL